jgi:hypothetical protein
MRSKSFRKTGRWSTYLREALRSCCSPLLVASRRRLLSGSAHLQARTVPPRGTLIATSPLRRDSWTAEATWDIEMEMRWEDYAHWVRAQPRGYSAGSVNGSALRFTKAVADDMYIVRIEAASVGPPLRLRVVFQGFPS